MKRMRKHKETTAERELRERLEGKATRTTKTIEARCPRTGALVSQEVTVLELPACDAANPVFIEAAISAARPSSKCSARFVGGKPR